VFLGIHRSEFGPTLTVGLGGTQVEVLRRVSTRLGPVDGDGALEMLDELNVPELFEGFRGNPAWDREELARCIVAFGHLAEAGRDWILSFDVNPLVFCSRGLVAVDGLCLVR
jgi:hypothetical protein